MRDYVTTVFNLIVGLVDADKIVYLALIGLGLLLVWQLLSLLTNFHRKFAGRCRKISKFLTKNGLSADNYNAFLALIAKMPQEFIRGYKTFEHASYGLPSDYIKRFDSIDVEVNGGLLNHGKSLAKATIYGWTLILFVLSLALLGSDNAITGYALADALIIPLLFLILAKIIYFIFNAIKQQQYKMAVDEFNEMLDIMNDKIENNDSLPGPDVLTELMDTVPVEENTIQESSLPEPQPEDYAAQAFETAEANEPIEEYAEPDILLEVEPQLEDQATSSQPYVVQNTLVVEEDFNAHDKLPKEEVVTEVDPVVEEVQPETQKEINSQVQPNTEPEGEVYTEEDLIDEVDQNSQEENYVTNELLEDAQTIEQADEEVGRVDEPVIIEDHTNINQNEAIVEVYEETLEEDADLSTAEAEVAQTIETLQEQEEPVIETSSVAKTQKKEKQKDKKEDDMEEKRGRGRPKKVPEGELVIKNDKQFEEVLQRAEKLMRKSEEALSSSQAKRVEKSLKELIDAMTKYKEEH